MTQFRAVTPPQSVLSKTKCESLLGAPHKKDNSVDYYYIARLELSGINRLLVYTNPTTARPRVAWPWWLQVFIPDDHKTISGTDLCGCVKSDNTIRTGMLSTTKQLSLPTECGVVVHVNSTVTPSWYNSTSIRVKHGGDITTLDDTLKWGPMHRVERLK